MINSDSSNNNPNILKLHQMSGSYDNSSDNLNSNVVSNSSINSEDNQKSPSKSDSNNDNGKNVNFANNLLVFKNPTKIKFQSRSKKEPNFERRVSLKDRAELDETHEEEEEEASKNLRQIFDKFFSIGKRMFYIQLYISILSFLSFSYYILCTYKPEWFNIMNYFDLFVSFCYFIEYFIHIILAHHRLVYLISLESIIHIITMIPNFFAFLTDDYKKSVLYCFINCSRVLRVLRIFKIFYLFKNEENNVNRQIMMIINTLWQLILIVAGIVQIVEYVEVEKRWLITKNIVLLHNLEMRTQFHHYWYFIIITVSTVGYGDIYPYTTNGKGIFMMFVLLIIVLIPYQTNDLIQLMSAQSDYARNAYKASKDIQHIVLTGDISIDSLRSFCWEFFHPDHGIQYRHAVIINTQMPSREMEIFLNEKANENFLFYWQGDPLSEKDLLRADIPKAKACIIFNNKNSKDPHTGDHQSLFLGIFIKKFVYTYNSDQSKALTDLNDWIFYSNPYFHLCMQWNKPESSCHYFNSLQPMYKKNLKQDQLIVIESIKMNLLSKSCLTPGIMALITNLVMSAGDGQNERDEAEWMKEYAEGRGHEIYRIQLQNYYKNMNFLEIAESVYNQEQAIVFALEIEISGVSIVKLNPSSSMKLIEIINKSKDINSSDKTKESRNNNNFNSIASEPSSHDRSKEKINYTSNNLESKIKIFAYLICSDKAVADRAASKDKNKERTPNKQFNAQQGQWSSNTNQLSVYNKDQELGQSIAVPQSSTNNVNNNKSTSKSIPLQHWQLQVNNNVSDSDSDEEEESGNEEIIQFGSSDWDFNKNDYYFNDSQEHYLRNNIEIMHHSIKDREDITNHIIICGLHPALVHFLLPLRAKYLQEDALKWIVILAPSLPQHLFEAFTKFRRIIFIQGSPWLPENLFRANILNADKAVILSSGESKVVKVFNPSQVNSNSLNNEEQMLDAETIFIYKAIQKCNKNIQIMTELICTNNIEYLLNTSNLQKLFYKQEEVPQYEFTPIYASGEVFTPSIVDRITCQSFYNPHIVTIIELILGGEKALSTKKTRKWDDFYKFPGSNLYLIKIPDPYINESFGDFFYFLIRHHHTISIALYRKNIIENFYYVYTNPKKTTLLRDCDFAFVWSNTNNILDLVDDKPFADNREGGSVSSESNSWIEDDNPSADWNLKERLSIWSKLDNTNIQKRNRKKEITKQSTSEQNRSDMKKYVSEDTLISQLQFSMKQKQMENSKHIEIERWQSRLNNIKQDWNIIKDNFVELPKYIDNIIDKEMDSEMMVYLSKI